MSDTTVTDVKTGGRSGIGAASLSASVFNFDPTLGCDSATFQPCSERALAGLEYLVRIYREHFPINHNIPSDQPVLLGIFPEDQVLDGGVSTTNSFCSSIGESTKRPVSHYIIQPSIPRSSCLMHSLHGTESASSKSQRDPRDFSSSLTSTSASGRTTDATRSTRS